MKTFAIFTLVVILGFILCALFALLRPEAVNTRETALMMLGGGLIMLVYSLVSISYMSKSRRWSRHRSRA